MPKILAWGLEEMREKIQPGKNNQIYLLGTLTSLAGRRNSMNILNIYRFRSHLTVVNDNLSHKMGSHSQRTHTGRILSG